MEKVKNFSGLGVKKHKRINVYYQTFDPQVLKSKSPIVRKGIGLGHPSLAMLNSTFTLLIIKINTPI